LNLPFSLLSCYYGRLEHQGFSGEVFCEGHTNLNCCRVVFIQRIGQDR